MLLAASAALSHPSFSVQTPLLVPQAGHPQLLPNLLLPPNAAESSCPCLKRRIERTPWNSPQDFAWKEDCNLSEVQAACPASEPFQVHLTFSHIFSQTCASSSQRWVSLSLLACPANSAEGCITVQQADMLGGKAQHVPLVIGWILHK